MKSIPIFLVPMIALGTGMIVYDSRQANSSGVSRLATFDWVTTLCIRVICLVSALVLSCEVLGRLDAMSIGD